MPKQISSSSLEAINRAMEEFTVDMRNTHISDTVKRMILESTPVSENEVDKKERIDDLNNLVTKSAIDLTNDAIAGKLVRTELGEYEQPANYLEAIVEGTEHLYKAEAIQRAEWFKAQIINGKIPNSEEDYKKFSNALNRTFQNKYFSSEHFKQEMELKKTLFALEEEEIIDAIKDSVEKEVIETEERQGKILQVMQTIQDTKKEVEEENEPTVANSENDPDTEALSDDEVNDAIEADSSANAANEANTDDTSTEDVNQNNNDSPARGDDPIKPSSTGESNEASGGLATNQNRDNFGENQSAGVGNAAGSEEEYDGPLASDGHGVLDEEPVQDAPILDESETEPNSDDSVPTSENPENDVPENIHPQPNVQIKEDPNTADVLTKTINPVLSQEEETDAEVSSPDASAESLVNKLLPVSLIKFPTTKNYTIESYARMLYRLGEKKADFFDLLKKKQDRFEEVLGNEDTKSTESIRNKYNKLIGKLEEANNLANTYALEMAYLGLDSRSITNKNSIVSLAIAKNILNRGILRERKRKYANIAHTDEYDISVEKLVDSIFNFYIEKKKLHKSQHIALSLEVLAQKEEKINGAIYDLKPEDKEQCMTLRRVLNNSDKPDKLFIASDLLLDFNNNLCRVNETQDRITNRIIDDEFVKRVVNKLHDQEFTPDEDRSVEEYVKALYFGEYDPTNSTNSTKLERIIRTLGHLTLNNSTESFQDHDERAFLFTKAKTYLTIYNTAKALKIASPEFLRSFEEQFSLYR